MSADDSSRTSPTLLLRLRDRDDRAAWGAFVDRYGRRIYDWCRRRNLQEADAEDLTQNLLLAIPAKLESFRYDPARGSFRGWLRAVVANALTDFVRRRVREGRLDFEPVASGDAEGDLIAALDAAFERDLFEEALARVVPRVSPVTWEAFRRTALGGEPAKAAAEALGLPVAHVYVYKGRVQELLRREIQALSGPGEE